MHLLLVLENLITVNRKSLNKINYIVKVSGHIDSDLQGRPLPLVILGRARDDTDGGALRALKDLSRLLQVDVFVQLQILLAAALFNPFFHVFINQRLR